MRKSVHTWDYAMLRKRLAGMRELAGISQRELARRLKVPHTWVAKVESGERRIDLIEFGWFCEACGVEPGEATRGLVGKFGANAASKRAKRRKRGKA